MLWTSLPPLQSLLSRSWKIVCITSFSSFIILQIFVLWNPATRSWTIGNDTKDQFSSWTWYAKATEATAFLICACLQTTRIFVFRDLYINTGGAYFISLCVNVIAGGGSAMTLFLDWGGTCSDVFGVKSPASIWTEWIVSRDTEDFNDMDIDDILGITSKRTNLCAILVLFTPSFAIVYLLGLSKTVNDDIFLVLVLICNFSTKAVFASIAMDAHLLLTNKDSHLLINDRYRYTSRALFSRNIFRSTLSPLESIRQAADSLSRRMDNLSPEDTELLLMIRDSSTFVQNSLVDGVYLQEKRHLDVTLNMNAVNIRELVKCTAISFQGAARKKRIDTVINISSDVPASVFGDGTRLSYVLVNLINNAIKYSEPGSRIHIAVMRNDRSAFKEKGKVSISFTVKDQGVGMTAVQIYDVIGDPGGAPDPGQTNRPTKHAPVNGLSISKNIVELHGGRISCESAVGFGSAFTFTIPFDVLEMECDADRDREGSGPVTTHTRERKATTVSIRQEIDAYLENDGIDSMNNNNNNNNSIATTGTGTGTGGMSATLSSSTSSPRGTGGMSSQLPSLAYRHKMSVEVAQLLAAAANTTRGSSVKNEDGSGGGGGTNGGGNGNGLGDYHGGFSTTMDGTGGTGSGTVKDKKESGGSDFGGSGSGTSKKEKDLTLRISLKYVWSSVSGGAGGGGVGGALPGGGVGAPLSTRVSGENGGTVEHRDRDRDHKRKRSGT
eukprot:gene9374-19450_t